MVEEPGKWFAPHIGSLITAGGRLLLAMLEKCIADAGGTFLFCDTDSAAIVSAEHRTANRDAEWSEPNHVHCPGHEVQGIVDRFDLAQPVRPRVGSRFDSESPQSELGRNKQRRQLFGYSIAAKRYALYTKTESDIEIVEPKAHGLGYFYPPKDSPEGWKQETPQWIFEAWDWIMRGVLGIGAHESCMVRSSGNDEVDAQHPASRSEESRQGSAHAPEQFHDDSADVPLWMSGTMWTRTSSR